MAFEAPTGALYRAASLKAAAVVSALAALGAVVTAGRGDPGTNNDRGNKGWFGLDEKEGQGHRDGRHPLGAANHQRTFPSVSRAVYHATIGKSQRGLNLEIRLVSVAFRMEDRDVVDIAFGQSEGIDIHRLGGLRVSPAQVDD